jgi:hypothetical protein
MSSPAPTEGPEAHTAVDLEQLLPDSVGGIALHKTSPNIGATLATDPRSATALGFLALLGKSTADIHFAQAVELADPLHLTIVAFQVSGVDAHVFGPAVIQAVLNSAPGAQQTSITMAGKPVIKASSTSGGPNAYLYERGDIVFGVETSDEALATEAMSKLP